MSNEDNGALFLGSNDMVPIVQRLRQELGCAGVLAFVVLTNELPVRASIASELSLDMMQQMPNILRQTADMMEKRVTQILYAGPPPGTKLS